MHDTRLPSPLGIGLSSAVTLAVATALRVGTNSERVAGVAILSTYERELQAGDED